jgi:hypothetical protein
VLLDSPRRIAAAEAAAAAVAAEDDRDEEDDAFLLGGSLANMSVAGVGGDGGCEDPVSQLKQALQHTRTGSVDAEAVMAALEENGFHATDAPGALCGC